MRKYGMLPGRDKMVEGGEYKYSPSVALNLKQNWSPT